MGYIAIISIVCALIFFIRLQMMRQQVKDMVTQLKTYHAEENEMKLAITLTDRLLEKLSVEINHIIDREFEAQANKLQVERELKEAISGMSHDLRTPLTAIIGYMQLIEEADLTEEEQAKYLSIAKRRAFRLQQLIQNFFSLSVVEADDYPLHMEKIELTSLVKDLLLAYYDEFQVKSEQLEINIPDEKISIIADQIACKRVIENILLNTIQHAEGKIAILLSVEGKEVIFSIRNELSETNINTEQIFNKFYTADQTRTYSGGLGLAIVKSLMNKMNGNVVVDVNGNLFTVKCKWEQVTYRKN